MITNTIELIAFAIVIVASFLPFIYLRWSIRPRQGSGQ